MNVYVVSLVWWRDGATVIGAGVDRADAETVADRYGLDDHDRVSGWTPWREEVSPSEGSCKWTRDAIGPNGTTHLSLSQEIVVVPLAGDEVRRIPPPIAEQVTTMRAVRRVGRNQLLTTDDVAEIGRQFGAP